MAYSKFETNWENFSSGGTPITEEALDHIEQGIFDAAADADAAQATADAAVPKSVVDAAGDLIVGSAADTVVRLAAGTAGQVLGGTGPSYAYPPGYEYAYTEFTSVVSPTATTEGTANTVVTASAVTFDGSTVVLIEFYSGNVTKGTTDIKIWMYQDGTSIGRIGYSTAATGIAMVVARRMTPASGSRTYSIRASVDAGTGAVAAGAGGLGLVMPGFIRITKV